MREASASDGRGTPLPVRRDGPSDPLSTTTTSTEWQIRLHWTLLCTELSVRSNHLDGTHLCLVPPFTWPELLDARRRPIESAHHLWLVHPATWTVATQLERLPATDAGETHPTAPRTGAHCACHLTIRCAAVARRCPRMWRITRWAASRRPRGASPSLACSRRIPPPPSTSRSGRSPTSSSSGMRGGPGWSEEAVQPVGGGPSRHHRAAMGDVRQHAVVALHNDPSSHGGSGGGLEHLRSQTSMMRREVLAPSQGRAWTDLLAHEQRACVERAAAAAQGARRSGLGRAVHLDLLWCSRA